MPTTPPWRDGGAGAMPSSPSPPVGAAAGVAADERVRELIQGVVDEVNASRSRYEQIKRFAIVPRDFTMEDGEMTPTLKLKRRVICERYADEIAALYDTRA